eukprot:468095_1
MSPHFFCTIKSFRAAHGDFIRDLKYDFYGRRLATCASDHKIKIYEKDEEGEWKHSQDIEGHSASVQKLAWAHPEYGQILASCSTDLYVHIYVESGDGYSSNRLWKLKCKLVDSTKVVSDIAFAPSSHGLRLATCAQDGNVRIYEAMDVMNLNSWSLVEQFQVSDKESCCIGWNESPLDPHQMAVGTYKSAKIWEYNPEYKRWQAVAELTGHTDAVYDVAWAPKMGRTFHLIATACKDGRVRLFKLRNEKGKYSIDVMATLSDHNAPVWRVSWNLTGTVLASSGDDGTARLWRRDTHGSWRCMMVAGDDEKVQTSSNFGESDAKQS